MLQQLNVVGDSCEPTSFVLKRKADKFEHKL